MKIDPDAFLKRQGIARLLKALDAKQGTARFVGGAVRDLLVDVPHDDLDLATTLAPAEVIERLESKGIKAVPTGIEHGTITMASKRAEPLTTASAAGSLPTVAGTISSRRTSIE